MTPEQNQYVLYEVVWLPDHPASPRWHVTVDYEPLNEKVREHMGRPFSNDPDLTRAVSQAYNDFETWCREFNVEIKR